MGRPKNSKDKKKRKRKTILNGTQERDLIREYELGKQTSVLTKKYGVTKSYISNMFRLRNISKRINLSIIKNWDTINDVNLLDNNISGVYSIYFVNKSDHNDIKIYIGSSVDIRTRLQSHHRELKAKKHNSSSLLEHFYNNDYHLKYAIVEKCSEDQILQRESYYLHSFNTSCLLNSWKSMEEETLRPWLEKATTYDAYAKNYTINNVTGCMESNNVHKTGYGRMRVTIGESTKHFYKHRIAYWEKYGEYPELIRHKCNNPRCYNSDHLEKGNHRDNNLDKRGNFPEIFEQKWIELKGDLSKLTTYFSDRWRGKTVSNAVYMWERKLNLRQKYPEILDANSDRRFSLSDQKLGISRKKKKPGANLKV